MGQIIKVAGIAGAVTLVLGTAVLADLSANTHDEKPTAAVTATATPTAQPTATVAPKPTATPTAKPAAVKAPACEEDQPCWDCKTMGNRVCGPTSPATIPANLAAPVKVPTVTVPVAPAKKYVPCSAVGMVADGQGVCHAKQAPAQPYVPQAVAPTEAKKSSGPVNGGVADTAAMTFNVECTHPPMGYAASGIGTTLRNDWDAAWKGLYPYMPDYVQVCTNDPTKSKGWDQGTNVNRYASDQISGTNLFFLFNTPVR